MSKIEKIIEGQVVEWDKKKSAINFQKHGVKFEDAALVFADVNRIERRDDRHSQDEERWQVIGAVGNILLEILFVVYTDRGEAVRLITARAATPAERSEYYGAQNYL